MANQCRAKDPSSCRVHGATGTAQSLKGMAENAADAGNLALYLSARVKLDTMTEGSVSSETIPAKAVDAAAKAAWDWADGFPQWESLGSDRKDYFREKALGTLDAAQRDMPGGVITDRALEETAKYNWEYRDSMHSWENSASDWQKEKYKKEARTVLEAAAPHMPKQPQQVIDTLHRTLGYTYKGPRFEGSAGMISDFASVLNDADKAVVKEGGSASPAAEYVRSRLLDRFSSNGVGGAAGATSDLFYALGRENELGWIREQVPGHSYQWKPKK
jgi:hypothetical protein